MQKFTLDDLVKRYDVAKGSISGYIKEHKNEIDPQAQHIFYASGKFSWMDETALAALDKLRGYRNEVTLLAEIELKEAEKKLKPLFNLFIKNAQLLSDEDVTRMVAHYKNKFAEKKEENK